MNKLDIQPRLGFAYAISDKMTIRGGIGENYMADQSTNGRMASAARKLYEFAGQRTTPYTSTTGQGSATQSPSFLNRARRRSAICRTSASHFHSSIRTTTYPLCGPGAWSTKWPFEA